LRSADGLSQFAAEDLSGGCFGHRVYEVDLAGLLVMGEAVGDEDAEFVSKFLAIDKSIAQGYESHGHLSGCVVATTHHTALFDCRMFQQDRFDLRGSHREALIFDHFLAPVDDTVEALAIAGDDIA